MATRRAGGRRPGTSQTREAILAAAIESFAGEGYAATTVRGVARAAQVDPALVIHFFGSKEGLFAAFLREGGLPVLKMKEAARGDAEGLGERLLRRYLSLWEDPVTGRRLRAMLTAVNSSPVAAEMMTQFIGKELLQPIADRLGLPDGETRAILAGSHLVGIAFLRYVVQAAPMTRLGTDELVAYAAPVLQRYLTPPPPDGDAAAPPG